MRLSTAVLATLAASVLAPAVARAASGTEYVVFWRGDLRIIATRPDTEVSLVDIETGGLLGGTVYTANIPGNPFVLVAAADSWEGQTVPTTQVQRVRIIARTASGPVEDKPVVVFTGSLAAAIKHPVGPIPPTTTNAWMSYLPAVSSSAAANGAEIGREFWGFVSSEMYAFARKGASSTWIRIEDRATNVETDVDDSTILVPASSELLVDDGTVEIYRIPGFEDDTVHVTANTDLSLLVGIDPFDNDWTATPPSYGAGEDFRELGTLFYTLVARDLTIFPTEDDTDVVITDLSDGDDSVSFHLANGDRIGDYDIFLADAISSGGTPITFRASAPRVTPITPLGANGPFDNDLVRVWASRPVLVYVGPKASDVNEYADVAYSIQTGPGDYLTYAYAQNGDAEDLQIFASSATTNVWITSLSRTSGAGHDFTIPTVTPWLGGNAVYDDWFWASGAWGAELLRIESDGPLAIIDGDYDLPNFGCFIPFVAIALQLPPMASAGPDLAPCPGLLEVELDASASFDQDTFPGPFLPTYTWDVDASVDADIDGDPTNDVDAIGETVLYRYASLGTYTVTLTFTDDDGVSDTDTLEVVLATPVTPRRLGQPLRAIKRPPADIGWSLPPAVERDAPIERIYVAGDKTVSPTTRVLVDEVETGTYLEAGALLLPDPIRYYQVVAVTCDGSLEGPY